MRVRVLISLLISSHYVRILSESLAQANPRANCLKTIPFTAAHTYTEPIYGSTPRVLITNSTTFCLLIFLAFMHFSLLNYRKQGKFSG